jgi:hypothetical protein
VAKNTVVVMVQVETDDPRLTPAGLVASVGSARGTQAMRDIVLSHLPGAVTRLIAVMPEHQARMLMMLHEAVGARLGDGPFVRPPPGYVPPTRD